MKVRCINDTGWRPEHLQWIKEFPVKDTVYTVRKRSHSINGLGYLLEELVNPVMPNGEEPSFSTKRFVPVPPHPATQLF